MTYSLPLEDRLRLAAYQRQRYWADDAFRLRCINRDRVRRGAPEIANLDELRPQALHRDNKGRFVKAADALGCVPEMLTEEMA